MKYGAEFFAGRSEMVIPSAQAVVPVLMDLFEPMSVLDIGCGQGEWLEAFIQSGCSFGCQGVDIAAPAPWLIHDLTEPLDLERTFDLVLCLETGEHLPEESADTLVDSCVRHSRTVVFGAAVPGQEGYGHINCQPHEYWHQKFVDRGYEPLDVIRPRIRGNFIVKPWYSGNIFAYVHGL